MICRLFKKTTLPTELPLSTVELGHGLPAILMAELGNGERGANNSGEFVEKYAAAVDRRAPILWCSALVYWGYLRECDLLEVEPIVGHKRSISAKGLRKEMLAAGGRDVSFEEARPGDVAIWHRGVRNSWKGHAGCLLSRNLKHNTFATVEGNRGSFPANVQTFAHSRNEAMFMTFVRWPDHVRTTSEEE